MERLEVNHVRYLFNNSFSCREKLIRFKHHVTLLSHYRVCKSIPKGFSLKFHCGTIEKTLQAQVNSILRKCSTKLMNLFEQHYKHKVSQLKQDEHKIVQSLTIFHPEQVDSILNQLQQRTCRQIDGNV